MKKVLLGSTALLLSAGVAAADVAVSGDGRMGIIQGYDSAATSINENDDIGFTSRIRIAFSASGETDGGLSFGGSIRADNSGGGASGTAGSVFVEGAFGKLSMGDVAGAAESVVGDISGVGLTGLGDANEFTYLSNNTNTSGTGTGGLVSSTRSGALYEYTTGAFTVALSAGDPADYEDSGTADLNVYNDGADTMSIAVGYSAGALSAGIGYENLSSETSGEGDIDHIIGGLSYAFGDATVKAVYGTADTDDASTIADFDQYGISLDYVMGATTLTVFYVAQDLADNTTPTAIGLGAAYDLGGGASLVGGYVTTDDDDDATDDDDVFDFGIKMSF